MLEQQLDGVWRIQVLDGPMIVIDQQHSQQKLSRFLAAFPQLNPQLRKSAQVFDLRYSNGFIVGNSVTNDPQ
jgi:cell division protein FtsQ